MASVHNKNVLKVEADSLESAVNKLLHAIIPDYTPTLPELNFPLEPQESEESDSDKLAESASPETPQSSSTLQISSDFTDLPLTYHKVTTADQSSLWSPVAPQKMATFSTHNKLPESVDGSLLSPLGSPLTLSSKYSSPETTDKSLQTIRLEVANHASQTPYTRRPTTRDSSTQTLTPMTTDSSSQTTYSRRLVMADRASQTTGIRLVSCSSQTPPSRKPATAERSSQTTHSSRPRAADKSSQTPGAWKHAVEESAYGLVKAKVRQANHSLQLPQTPPQGEDLVEREGHASVTPYGSHLKTPWVTPAVNSSSTVNEDKDLHTPNGFLDQAPRVFVAVMDYDPNSLCTTGRPELELCVHIGKSTYASESHISIAADVCRRCSLRGGRYG